MPKFYCLYNSFSDSLNVKERLIQLENACLNSKVEFVKIDEGTANFFDLPTPRKNDALFNCSRGSMLLERILINKDVKTFYRSFPFTGITEASNYWSILHEKLGVSTPKTIWKGINDKILLKKYVEYLGGFPIIIKTFGGTGGIGVMKVDNYPILFSLTDYLNASKSDFAMRQFITSKTCERLIVLGDEVIAGVSRPNKDDDFRSDSYDVRTSSKKYETEINKLAIKAVNEVNLNLAGVDIIIDERDGKPYVLEMNFPLNFITTQNVTGVNIAEKMIKWLFK